ncbi:MAG: IS110 family transposase [Mesorhizobium sp.]|nr:MAG: IS110 family transposase [Mesorhizobium sp.]RWQ45173.1 MAG: IS110 family transposase [Mesorhizobium sp.]
MTSALRPASPAAPIAGPSATTGIKLASVLSDVFGVSGRAIVRALIAGTHTPQQMAALARGTARRKYAALVKALDVRLEGHQRLMLECQLQRVESAEADIAALDVEIDRRLDPYAEQVAALLRVPGIDRVVAITVIAEIGIDVSMFPTAAHLAAWAGVCPGNHQSAGKSKPTKARKGNRHLKTALCNAAISASKKTGSYYKAKYHKLKARRGGGKAALAIQGSGQRSGKSCLRQSGSAVTCTSSETRSIMCRARSMTTA